ncbi:MAG TPA: hypothetical protein DCR93_00725 [Cytophagales bacterium]|nr:hypothetical protein [Cytophagales bacterium]HAP58084.1 hypothetical protein [Cytophagales bacterium]
MNSMKTLYSVALAAMVVLAACQPETVEPSLTLIEGEVDYTLSQAEVDELLIADFGHADFDLAETMEYLSDYYAGLAEQDRISAQGRAESDQYVAVAQVFDGTTYYTDVDTGTPSQSVRARTVFSQGTFYAFVGANANVYFNGSNVDGEIDNASPLNCGSDDVRVISDARYFPQSPLGSPAGTSAYVIIGCDD